eukprot:snap_masked-scaffold_42-processed-gene-1.28-mRNA-1 protein AED:1.00 eAED:1.00 QI:0/0/0/0/1/1/2/0/67
MIRIIFVVCAVLFKMEESLQSVSFLVVSSVLDENHRTQTVSFCVYFGQVYEFAQTGCRDENTRATSS